MPVDKAGLQALVRREAVDVAEKHKLLLLVAKAELWDGLEEDEVLGVLRLALAETASGRTCTLHQAQQAQQGGCRRMTESALWL